MFGLPKLQLLLVLRVQLHSGCNCCSQWLQLTFVVKYATLICKLCKYIHECLHHKTAEANNCNSFKYLLQRLQTKFAALKICNPGCTLDANICSVYLNTYHTGQDPLGNSNDIFDFLGINSKFYVYLYASITLQVFLRQ